MMQGNFQASDLEKEMDFVAEKRNTQKNSKKLKFSLSAKRIHSGESGRKQSLR
jgi:hypothetical protein